MLALALAGCSGGGQVAESGSLAGTQSPSGANGSTPASEATMAVESSASGTASATRSAAASAASPSASDEFVPASSEGPAQNVPVPEMPAEAREQTEEGLEAALEYWWEANYFLKSTGDPRPLDSVSMDSCGVCQSQLERWPRVYQDEAWVVTKPAIITFDLSDVETNRSSGTSLFRVTEAPGELYMASGRRVEEASSDGSHERPWAASVTFDNSDGYWRVDDIRTQD
ncbi:hypothetical protein E7744_06850 [Citricoccus sp. SGAir0253]|uniref:DUF6318 family protein n=1 Tax=Citricoccus sp. SGAir0253 TaxID=2567881 RepID=UPI0010CCCEBE|nr:DUF6318 family protein [Citricoccus sp. SGAir0253]QCU77931.1 hypothetical protein E7744_06850 [Citricoccus sp. SGAir0253]